MWSLRNKKLTESKLIGIICVVPIASIFTEINFNTHFIEPSFESFWIKWNGAFMPKKYQASVKLLMILQKTKLHIEW